MPPKLPACDPCRAKKLACDHLQPACSRCREGDLAASCTYRSRPFKKRQIRGLPNNVHEPRKRNRADLNTSISLASPLEKSRQYPNPGYLGSSSHTTLFNHLSSGNSPDGDIDGARSDMEKKRPKLRPSVVNDEKIAHGAALIKQVCQLAKVSSWGFLVEGWTARGVNLPLADSFTMQCAQTVRYMLENVTAEDEEIVALSKNLFFHSCSSLAMGIESTLGDFCATFCGNNARWETMGLFFTALSRATIDVPYFDVLYDSDQERRNLQRLAMYYSDSCLDLALSLDCLNDLQLILQYENFILHSLVDGDQSYHSWRKLGDVASSLFALGYHEQLGHRTATPDFLIEMRQAAFNRAYSADKNVSIFLGRPPRINKKYCPIAVQVLQWVPEEKFNYKADTQWSAVCALLKEDILDLRKKDHGTKAQEARLIRADAETQWAVLPVHFHLAEPIISYELRPVELDFMVSARLNYLHVVFLLRLTLVLRISEPDDELLAVSADMLSLVAEAVVLKERLANSGTSLIWKVAYYGLAAAGVICLALLKNAFGSNNVEVSASRAIRDLSVLVAQVETGALVQPEDPNYALLSGATQTIKNLLDRLITNRFAKHITTELAPDVLAQPPTTFLEEDWSYGIHDFDPDFWLNLAEHPFLIAPDASMQDFSWTAE